MNSVIAWPGDRSLCRFSLALTSHRRRVRQRSLIKRRWKGRKSRVLSFSSASKEIEKANAAAEKRDLPLRFFSFFFLSLLLLPDRGWPERGGDPEDNPRLNIFTCMRFLFPEMRLAVPGPLFVLCLLVFFSTLPHSSFYPPCLSFSSPIFSRLSRSRRDETRREERHGIQHPRGCFHPRRVWGPDYARKLKPSSIYASIVETLRPFRVTLYVCVRVCVCVCFFLFFFPSFSLSSPFTHSTTGKARRGFTVTRVTRDGVRSGGYA